MKASRSALSIYCAARTMVPTLYGRLIARWRHGFLLLVKPWTHGLLLSDPRVAAQLLLSDPRVAAQLVLSMKSKSPRMPEIPSTPVNLRSIHTLNNERVPIRATPHDAHVIAGKEAHLLTSISLIAILHRKMQRSAVYHGSWTVPALYRLSSAVHRRIIMWYDSASHESGDPRRNGAKH